MTATRVTPTTGNGGSDNGVTYTDAVDAEIEALWRLNDEFLISVGGTGDAITATADSSVVSPVLSINKGKRFWFVAAADNTGAATIAIDSVSAKTIKDIDGATLQASAIVAGRLHLIIFDGTNFRLQSGSSSGTASSSSDFEVQGGRLTLTTGVPVITTGVTAATVLYWTPYKHKRIGLYDGAAWGILTQTEKSIKLTDAQSGATHNGTKVIDGLTDTSQLIVGMKISGTNVGAAATIQSIDSPTQVTATVNSTGSATNTITFKLPASTNFDVFGYNNSSALKLEFCAWSSGTARATALTTQDGIKVKSGDATRRYLGTIRTTTTDGQTEYSFGGSASGGTAANLLVWNYDNSKDVSAVVTDSATAYIYSTATVRSANASTSNRVNVVVGISESPIRAIYTGHVTDENSVGALLGIGVDSTTAASGVTHNVGGTMKSSGTAAYSGFVSAGFHFLQALEKGDPPGGGQCRFNTVDGGSTSVAAVLQVALRM